MLQPMQPRRSRWVSWSAALSVLVHAAFLAGAILLAYRSPQLIPVQHPGTRSGALLLTYYSPGSRLPANTAPTPRSLHTRWVIRASHNAAAATAPVAADLPKVDSGSGSSAQSGVGDGNLSIALVQRVLYPHPDLASLPHGARGDVVLNAVIDEHGKIAELTLLKGLSPAIDESVMATVKEWLFTPATKDGMPVASEQELHFHYERG